LRTGRWNERDLKGAWRYTARDVSCPPVPAGTVLSIPREESSEANIAE
jgi:hypothetical protein